MIWYVEDEPSARELVLYALLAAGFSAQGFASGNEFWQALEKEQPRLILLDVMLPEIDGIELLRRIKSNVRFCSIPVIMASAKGAEYDKIHCLDLGADDYLAKPYSMQELIARIKAVLRRTPDSPALLSWGGLSLNPVARTLFIDSQYIPLTRKEFDLLLLFLSYPNITFTRSQLHEEVWGNSYIGETRTVDMHILTLRHKLGPYASSIETVRNVGYRLNTKGSV